MFRLFILISIFLTICAGCAHKPDGTWKPPLVYRVDIQQGNVVDQSMINKLKPGMDKKQVRFIMGTPLLQDPFHSDRWDYIYSFEPGGGDRKQRHIALHFNDDKLVKITGDVETSYSLDTTEEQSKGRTVVVPLEDHEEGFLSKLFGKSPENKALQDKDETPEGTQESTETAIADETTEPAAETALTDEDKQTVTTTQESTEPDNVLKTESEEPVPEIKKTETTKEKNIFRRVWDRVTSSEEDSTEDVEETERDKRDAEIFEEAGGKL